MLDVSWTNPHLTPSISLSTGPSMTVGQASPINGKGKLTFALRGMKISLLPRYLWGRIKVGVTLNSTAVPS